MIQFGAAFEWMRARLSNRPDSEHGQALVRMIIACLLVGYIYFLRRKGIGDGEALSLMLMVMLAEAFVGMTILASIFAHPAASHPRRWVGMIGDYTVLAVLMLVDPRSLAPLYVLILWVTIGNGLRYGMRYLFSATLLGLIAFTTVVLGADYWREQPHLSAGLLIGLVAIPTYLSTLLRSLHRSTEEARRANAAKSRFLATMSHELRSPLNGIVGMAELIRNTRLSPEQREYAEVIHTSAQTLSLLVDDVLDISAIEAGKLQRKEAEFNLRELTGRLEKMLKPQAVSKELELRVTIAEDVPLELYGDSGHLIQILLNLLNNAIKFTETGSVSLDIIRARTDDRALRLGFSVRDTGIGIPDEYKQKIFEAFEQVDTGPTRRFGGTGLGTTIARTLTQLLDGTILLEDNPGGGSHFRVEIPFAEAETSHSFAGKDAGNVVAFGDPFIRHRARTKQLRILVADDQHANRVVLGRILEHAGHTVTVVSDGEEALNAFEGIQFDLAVLDMHMPGVSGLDVIRQLRFMQAGHRVRTPIIVMSADATEQAMKDASAAGAETFMTKPIMVAKFLETVADLVTRQTSTASKFQTVAPLISTNSAVLEELSMMGLGNVFLLDFVEQCLKDLSGCTENLVRAAQTADWSDFRDAAHAMKGVSDNLGAASIAERCREIMRSDDASLARRRNALISEIEAQLILVAEHSRQQVARLLSQRAAGGDVQIHARQQQTPAD
jgi:two-component system, sensor histidine kinase RpfC